MRRGDDDLPVVYSSILVQAGTKPISYEFAGAM